MVTYYTAKEVPTSQHKELEIGRNSMLHQVPTFTPSQKMKHQGRRRPWKVLLALREIATQAKWQANLTRP